MVTDSHNPINKMRATRESDVRRQAWTMDERPRLLGGSLGDWSVLVGGVALAALFAAVFVL
jgi:hypothetical protein